MRRLESDTVLNRIFATDTNPVLPLPVIFQHLTLASVLLIRRALGGRYNNVGIRAASSPGPPLSRTASGPDIPSGLLGDSRTAPARIPPFHLNNSRMSSL